MPVSLKDDRMKPRAVVVLKVTQKQKDGKKRRARSDKLIFNLGDEKNPLATPKQFTYYITSTGHLQ